MYDTLLFLLSQKLIPDTISLVARALHETIIYI